MFHHRGRLWRCQGFSLIEMICIVAIISILLAIGSLQFRDYMQRARMEAQTRLLFSQLSKTRVNAICQRRGARVMVFVDRFEVYSSLTDGSAVGPVETHRVSYPLISKNLDLVQGASVDFDERGVTNDWTSVCIEPAGSGAVDSVVVAATRIGIGKRGKGNVCESDYITPR